MKESRAVLIELDDDELSFKKSELSAKLMALLLRSSISHRSNKGLSGKFHIPDSRLLLFPVGLVGEAKKFLVEFF